MRKKILLINNTIARAIISEILSRDGHGVDVVHDSDDGLQQLAAQTYDVIIVQENRNSEIWKLCEKIRNLAATPLIVISSNASTSTCVKAINAGADYFLRKPFGPLELLARVNSLLQRTAFRHPVAAGL